MTAPKKPAKEAPAEKAGAADHSRGICLAAGILTTDEMDGDGLPKWMRDPELGYHHANTQQVAFAVACMLYGFNLPEFDLWLSALENCGAKTELLERRKLAWEATRNNKPEDSRKRHLEWMLLRWQNIRREEFILPLARTGQKVRAPFADGNAQRSISAQQQQEAWQILANKEWEKNARLSASDVAKRIAAPGENPDLIRRRIRKLS